MESVEVLVLDYHVFNVSWQTIIRGSEDIRLTRHFKNVCIYDHFRLKSYISRIVTDILNTKSD